MSGIFNTQPIPVLSAKAPEDQRYYGWDFSRVLTAGETISAIGSITVTSFQTDLEVGTPSIQAGTGGSGLMIVALISAGSVGNSYVVTAECSTTNGETISRSIIIPVADR